MTAVSSRAQRGMWVMALVGSCTLIPGCESARQSSRGFHLPQGDADRGRQLFIKLDCPSCHYVFRDEGLPAPIVEPPVPVVIGGETPYPPTDGQLVTAIIDPSYSLGPAHKRKLTTTAGVSRMDDFADVMTVRELSDLVAYIRTRYILVTFHDRATGPLPK